MTNKQVLRFQTMYERNSKMKYIIGALHPSVAFANKWDVRLPTPLPIPTACLRVLASHNLTTGSSGQLYINYVPGTLIGSNALTSGFSASGITVNTTCNGSGNVGQNAFVEQPFYMVPQMWDRFRLVGAEIKVTYTGNIFNKQGAIFGGVHYEASSICTRGTSGTVTSSYNTEVNRFSGNLGLIKNQLYARSTQLTEQEYSQSFVWTPDSAVNYLFPGNVNSSTSIGSVLNSTTCYQVYNTDIPTVRTNTGLSNTSGPDRQFNFFLQGLPTTSQCVRVDIWELFEYIPDVSAMNVVSVSKDRMSNSEHSILADIDPGHSYEYDNHDLDDIHGLLDDMSLGKHPNSHKNKSTGFWNRVTPLLSKLGDTMLNKSVDFFGSQLMGI